MQSDFKVRFSRSYKRTQRAIFFKLLMALLIFLITFLLLVAATITLHNKLGIFASFFPGLMSVIIWLSILFTSFQIIPKYFYLSLPLTSYLIKFGQFTEYYSGPSEEWKDLEVLKEKNCFTLKYNREDKELTYRIFYSELNEEDLEALELFFSDKGANILDSSSIAVQNQESFYSLIKAMILPGTIVLLIIPKNIIETFSDIFSFAIKASVGIIGVCLVIFVPLLIISLIVFFIKWLWYL